MKSARARIAVNSIFIIIITVIIMEVVFIGIIKHNYYLNMENNLINQLKVSTDIYSRYFSDSSLQDNVLNDVEAFWKQATAQVEIIDIKGRVLMDSVGVIPDEGTIAVDVREALKGETGKWIGRASYSNDNVMSVSYPLRSKGNIIGVLRFISSLKEIDREIKEVAVVFAIIGVTVILVSGFISLVLADSIVAPLEEITKAAQKMASGDFHVRCQRRYDDEVGKLSDTLNYMAEEILKKDQLKNDFISSVSHELRTPLTSIKGWAVTLKSIRCSDQNNQLTSDEEIFADGLEIIEKESDRLTSMVEELLELSKLVSGRVMLKKNKIIIEDIMCHIEKQLMPRAKKERIEFEIFCAKDLPAIITDENKLKQVFINILDNSFKFTGRGGRICFNARTKGKYVYFSIKDTGCGIPPEDLPKVKEKFFKGTNSKSKNGIGLSICDEIIVQMNGSFEIKSEVGKGTEVIIIIPDR